MQHLFFCSICYLVLGKNALLNLLPNIIAVWFVTI